MRSLIKAAIVAASASTLALTAASAAGAATAGGQPQGDHHHHQRTHQFCFASLLTETDTLGGMQITLPSPGDHGQGGPAPQVTTPAPGPSTSAPVVNGTNDQGGQGSQGDHRERTKQLIEVVQLVQVCETIENRGDHRDQGGKWADEEGRGKVIAVTATDVSAPFAWLFPADDQQGPGGHAPGQMPGQIRGLLIQH